MRSAKIAKSNDSLTLFNYQIGAQVLYWNSAQMKHGEKPYAKFRTATCCSWAVDNCDLCITDKRLVVLAPNRIFGAQAPLLVGQLLAGLVQLSQPQYKNALIKKKTKSRAAKGLTIDELLQKDRKSYAVPYGEMDWLCLNRSRLGSNLTFGTKKLYRLLKLNREQVEQLTLILPNIEALKGKFKIN